VQPGPDLQTVAIYAPVVGQLAKVEERLRGVCQTDIADLNPLLDYALSSGGKRVRPALTLLAAEFREHERERSLIMASAVELLHLATLIHDDTVDNAGMRRGKPTINKLYGNHVAVLLGDYLFATSATFVCDTGVVRVIRRFSETIMELASGQLIEFFTTFDPTKARKLYNERIYRKTASLFCTSAESGAILSDAPEHEVKALRQYGYNIGMAFQIVDDLLDVQGDASEIGKPVGNDLLQGVLTLPAIMLMERYPNDHPIDSLFAAIKSGQGDVTELLDRSVGMITDSNIIPDCFTVIREYCSSASEALAVLPDCPPRRSLSDMVDFIRERSR
jgi:geranylgeranyl pyrophosphate synthase